LTTKCCVKFANAINKLVLFACCGWVERIRGRELETWGGVCFVQNPFL